MVRGGTSQTKVFYKGSVDDFVIFVESSKDVQAWKKDSSVPLAQVVSAFSIYQTHRHGTQGVLDNASKTTLENEFGTANEEEVIKKILHKGHMQESEMSERQGPKNDSKGPMSAH